MTQIWKKIHKNNVQLIERLDIERILDYMYQEDVFTENDYENVRAERIRSEKIREFLSILKRKSNECHIEFLNCLKTVQSDLAEQIENTVINPPTVTDTTAVTTDTSK